MTAMRDVGGSGQGWKSSTFNTPNSHFTVVCKLSSKCVEGHVNNFDNDDYTFRLIFTPRALRS